MSALAGIRVQLSVVLGSTRLPIQQVLKMAAAPTSRSIEPMMIQASCTSTMCR